MRLKIEVLTESNKAEGKKSGLSIEFHSKRGEMPVIDRNITIPEGNSEVVSIGPGQMLVIKAPKNADEDVVYDPEQKAAVPRGSLSPEKQAALPNTVYPSDTPPNMEPGPNKDVGPAGQVGTDGKTIPSPVAQAGLPHGGQDKKAGLEGNLANPQTTQQPGAQPGQSTGNAAPSQPQPTKTFSVPPPKTAEKDKDASGNPIPAVDQRGPTSHAPPPSDTKKG